MTLEVLSANHDVAHLLYIDNIDEKFEEPTPCRYARDKNVEMPTRPPQVKKERNCTDNMFMEKV